jgi:hypothetical protein
VSANHRAYQRAARESGLTANLASALGELAWRPDIDPEIPTADLTFRTARALERRGLAINLPTRYTRITPAGLATSTRVSARFAELMRSNPERS